MKLCVFPNDPIQAYYDKGEIKERYYNPQNIFSEIHFITLIDQDIEVSKIQVIGGKAKIVIHSVGKINIKNRNKRLEDVIAIVKEIQPDVVRAYNPFIEGWLAAKCAKELKIPFLLSLHTQYDGNRRILKKTNFKKYLVLKYTEKFIEPYVLKSADKITAIYKIIEPYVLKHCHNKPEILHNKVDCEKFANATALESLQKPLILSVGALISVKNHECVIQSMKNVNANLMIIGNGLLHDKLQELIKKNNLDSKIIIKKSVPHNQIQNYYKSADIFALAYNPEIEGIPMPVMEAMATGLAIVIPPSKENFSEKLEGSVVFAESNPDSFARSINELLDDKLLHKKFADRAKIKALEFDIEKIEKREAEIYTELVSIKN